MVAEEIEPRAGARVQLHPLRIVSRIIAAIFGGYALSVIAAVFLSYILPMQRADALMTGILFSFAIHVAAALWVFAARTSISAWLGLIIPGAAMAGVCYLFTVSNGA